MRKICGFVVLLIVCLGFSSVVRAEDRTAEEYMAEGIRAAYDNMHLIYQGFYDDEGNLEEQPAGHVAIWQEWDGDQLISRTYLGSDGKPVKISDGYAKKIWAQDEVGTWSIAFSDENDKKIPIEGINLATDINVNPDGWTDWMTPETNVENWCINVGTVNLGTKQAGDIYICAIEIEFSNVTGAEGKWFGFRTQGMVDKQWHIENVWNRALVKIDAAPEDKTYQFSSISTISEEMKNASTFDIGFRCDNWASGSFRVRNIKIEKRSTLNE